MNVVRFLKCTKQKTRVTQKQSTNDWQTSSQNTHTYTHTYKYTQTHVPWINQYLILYTQIVNTLPVQETTKNRVQLTVPDLSGMAHTSTRHHVVEATWRLRGTSHHIHVHVARKLGTSGSHSHTGSTRSHSHVTPSATHRHSYICSRALTTSIWGEKNIEIIKVIYTVSCTCMGFIIVELILDQPFSNDVMKTCIRTLDHRPCTLSKRALIS